MRKPLSSTKCIPEDWLIYINDSKSHFVLTCLSRSCETASLLSSSHGKNVVPFMYLKKKLKAEEKNKPVMATTVQEPVLEFQVRTATTTPWNVIVWDDPVNLSLYVTWVFRHVFGYSEEKAYGLMLKIDKTGKSIVWTGDRERAEMYVQQLHSYQLKTTLERVGKEEG